MGTRAKRVTSAETVRVTPDNFNRAELDVVLTSVVKDGGFGKFNHHREALRPGFPVVRPLRDTLYSMAVFDLDAGPVKVTLPDTGARFMSLQIIDQNLFALKVIYSGSITLTREEVETRYVLASTRTLLLRPDDPKDVEEVHRLQDSIQIEQLGGPGKFEIPRRDDKKAGSTTTELTPQTRADGLDGAYTFPEAYPVG